MPGQTGQIPNSVAPVAEMLRLNGYSTAAFGKWHELATWETSVSGSFARWPTVGGGFDKFYGFLGGETKEPQKLKQMQALFMKEAEKYQVLPLDDRSMERSIAALAGRPDLMAGRTSLTLAEGMTGMQENVFLNVKNKSSTITAEVEIPQAGAEGAILVQGGRFGGWALYMTGGKPAYAYNWLGLQRYTIAARDALPPGKATIRLDFKYDGGGMGKGGTGTLSVNGRKVAEGRIERTQAAIFSAEETADVGIDLGTPVVEAVGAEEKSRFTGKIPKVTLEIRDENPRAEAAVKNVWAEARHKTE